MHFVNSKTCLAARKVLGKIHMYQQIDMMIIDYSSYKFATFMNFYSRNYSLIVFLDEYFTKCPLIICVPLICLPRKSATGMSFQIHVLSHYAHSKSCLQYSKTAHDGKKHVKYQHSRQNMRLFGKTFIHGTFGSG